MLSEQNNLEPQELQGSWHFSALSLEIVMFDFHYYVFHGVFNCIYLQGINVVEQEQLDNIMIQMDGTEKKCESQQVATNQHQHPQSVKINADR